MRRALALAAVAAALALAPGASWGAGAVPPGLQAARDLYIRFERNGFHGGAYLNADHSYVIVQTGPDGRTEAFTGRWSEKGATGFCLAPDGDTPGKCFDTMPPAVGKPVWRTSDRGEHYRLTVRRAR